jgi:two-component system phosphate regulon response regulator PhoB
VLTDEGFDVMGAENGEQALTALDTIRPALVTLDLDLPGVTGEQVLAELRRRDATHDLPVIIVSAKHPIPRNLRALAQELVAKPFDIDELLAVVYKFVPPPEQMNSVGEK